MNGIESTIPVKAFEDSSGVGQRALVNSDNRQEVCIRTGTSAVYSRATSMVLKATPGVLASFLVTDAGSAAGAIHDCATIGAANAANKIIDIPTSVSTSPVVFNWATNTGIVYIAGTSEAVSFNIA